MKRCVLSESYRAHRLSADRVLEDGNFSGYCFLLPRESYVAGSRMVKEFTFRLWRSSTRIKEASKEFKILFIGIVHKATWKAMKNKAFIRLHCLPTYLHLRTRPNVSVPAWSYPAGRISWVRSRRPDPSILSSLWLFISFSWRITANWSGRRDQTRRELRTLMG